MIILISNAIETAPARYFQNGQLPCAKVRDFNWKRSHLFDRNLSANNHRCIVNPTDCMQLNARWWDRRCNIIAPKVITELSEIFFACFRYSSKIVFRRSRGKSMRNVTGHGKKCSVHIDCKRSCIERSSGSLASSRTFISARSSRA